MPRPRDHCPLPRPAGPANVLRLALCALVFAGLAQAQTSAAVGPLAPPQAAPSGEDIPLVDYLGLLQQIAPAAEIGARTYLAGIRLRCGRDLSTAELRRAMAHESGDPVLMGLIRAAHLKDRAAQQQLVTQIQCARGGMR